MGEKEVCVAVLGGGIEELSKVDRKHDHESIGDDSEQEPCTKKQAEEVSNVTELEPQVLDSCGKDTEKLSKIDPKRDHECLGENNEDEPCPKKQARKALNGTESKLQVLDRGGVELMKIDSRQDHECLNINTELRSCTKNQAMEVSNSTDLDPQVLESGGMDKVLDIGGTELSKIDLKHDHECIGFDSEHVPCSKKHAMEALDDTEMEPQVLDSGGVDIEKLSKIDSKYDDECLGNKNEDEMKKQALEVLNDTETKPQVLDSGGMELLKRIESKNGHGCFGDDNEHRPCTKQTKEVSYDTELEPQVLDNRGMVSEKLVKIEYEHDHECLGGDNEHERCINKQGKDAWNVTELDSLVNKQFKEISNDDISSEVSNPNVSPRDNACSLQAINSIQKPESGSKKEVCSDEESLSEEEQIKNEKPTSSFVLEIPKHICSSGIRKITFKFSKPEEGYDNKSSLAAVRSVTDGAFDSFHNLSEAKNAETGTFRQINEAEESDKSFSRCRDGETEASMGVSRESYPTNVKKLLSIGVLEGARVKYISTSRKLEIPGFVKDWGYLCGCSLCNYTKIVSAYEFELHAGVNTKHPNNHIFLENGKPIYSIIQELKTAPLNMMDEVIRNVAGSSLNEEKFHAWRASLQQKTKRVKSVKYEGRKSEKYEERNWTANVKKPVTYHGSSAPHKKRSEGGTKRRDNDLHRVLFMPNGLPDGAELAYYSKGQRVLGGYKQGNGIVCSCCHTEISPSQFEAHAGWSARRQPYRNIYTSSGLTLHDIALSLTSGQKLATGSSDDMCAGCGDGGDLLFCRGCPRAFHAVCLNLECPPEDHWYCPFCRDKLGLGQKVVEESSNVGRPIIIRMTRVVKAPQIETGGCVFCRANDFSAGTFDDRTVMLCDQCEREYHVGCLRDRGLADLKELPKDMWFCCIDCNTICIELQNRVLLGAEAVPLPALKFINRKHSEKGYSDGVANDVQWRILSGKSRVPEHLPVLSRAAAIFRECFDPIVASSGRDLIPVMVYGRNISGQEFGGMYCIVLIVKSVVVSAGLLRILGRDAAELPLVATSRQHQGKGYFQALFSCIEGLLYSLNVENVVLPAAEDAESIWTKKLGFRKMSDERFLKYMRDIQLTTFKGTSMLEKRIHRIADW